MNCPVCREPMIVLELNEIEIDHCIFCQGIWLDSGELELLLENSKKKEAFLSSFEKDKKTTEKGRKCPICLKKMKKVLYGLDKKVRLDKCPRNDGIWFDEREIEEVLKIGCLDEDNRVLNLLRDMFKEKNITHSNDSA